ncbi:MAG: hypothetical protein ACK4HE_00625 [Chitinophagaceae bacterium]
MHQHLNGFLQHLTVNDWFEKKCIILNNKSILSFEIYPVVMIAWQAS